MSCPSFYSKNASDYVAVGSTVTGNNKLFWVISLQTLDFSGGNPCKTIHPVKTSGIDGQKIAFQQELASHRPVFLQSSCSDSAECKFEKVWGSKICATVQLAWSTSSYMGSGLSLKHRYSSLISKNVASFT